MIFSRAVVLAAVASSATCFVSAGATKPSKSSTARDLGGKKGGKKGGRPPPSSYGSRTNFPSERLSKFESELQTEHGHGYLVVHLSGIIHWNRRL
mmetsp:Transcript_3274/g.6774  ORF Transcript_3274/g.6774 Transcript_3274/m.6774 type:complete len:95 (+) Transcript_3274:2959-3243(+)